MNYQWIVGVLSTLFLPGSVERLSVWIDSANEQVEYTYNVIKATTWWAAAYTGCDDVGGSLVTKSTYNKDVWNQIKRDTLYWVGAVETFSPWTWTEDNTTLFEHVRELNVSVYSGSTFTTISNNDAFSCCRHCKTTLIGLQGRRCYCNVPNGGTVSSNRKDNVRCPGTYQEYCGGENTVSVYKHGIPENLMFRYYDQATCAYLYYKYNVFKDDIFALILTKYCRRNRYYACPVNAFGSNKHDCSQDVCTSTDKSTWTSALQKCSNKLIKLTTAVMEDLMDVISYYWCWECGYWVGLNRSLKWKWIDGSDFVDHSYVVNKQNPEVQECIAMRKTNTGDIELKIMDCSKKLPAICQIHKPKSTTSIPSTTTSTSSSANTDTTSTTATQTDNDHASSSASTATTSSTQSAKNTTEPLRQTSEQSGSGGLTAGVAVGVVALLGLAGVIVVVWMKRKHRYCFQSTKTAEPESVASRERNAAVRPSNDYELPGFTNSVYNGDEGYCTIPANTRKTNKGDNSNANCDLGGPVYENYSRDQINAQRNNFKLAGPPTLSLGTDDSTDQSNDNEYELAAAASSRPCEVDPAQHLNTTSADDDYELAAADDTRTRAHSSADALDDLSRPTYFQLDDTADSESDTQYSLGQPNIAFQPDDYELAGCPEGHYEYEEMDREGCSDEYNTLHDTGTDTSADQNYSHIGATQLNDDLYNTTEPTQRERVDDNVYSHVRGDQFENEDAYNHIAGSRDKHVTYDPEYSQVGAQ